MVSSCLLTLAKSCILYYITNICKMMSKMNVSVQLPRKVSDITWAHESRWMAVLYNVNNNEVMTKIVQYKI